jgi:hypothetical protein
VRRKIFSQEKGEESGQFRIVHTADEDLVINLPDIVRVVKYGWNWMCPGVGFGISSTKPSGSATTLLSYYN